MLDDTFMYIIYFPVLRLVCHIYDGGNNTQRRQRTVPERETFVLGINIIQLPEKSKTVLSQTACLSFELQYFTMHHQTNILPSTYAYSSSPILHTTLSVVSFIALLVSLQPRGLF